MKNENIHKFAGKHVTAELYCIEDSLLNDLDLVISTLKSGIKASGATLLEMIHHKFQPEGFTILGLLSESHTSVHTYPEKNALFFDAFTCGNSDPNLILDELIKVLKPKEIKRDLMKRGNE